MQPVTVVLCIVVLGAHLMLVLGDCKFSGKTLKVGETFKPADRCIQHTCQANGVVIGTSCPSLSSLKPCKLVEDVKKPFPDCCPYFDCSKELKL